MQKKMKPRTMMRRARRAERSRKGRNGFIDVVSPATFSEVRKTLRIEKTHIDNVLRAFEAVGVKI